MTNLAKLITKNQLLQRPNCISSYFKYIVLLVLFISISLQSAISYTNELDKEMLKAIYTYKFGKFTQWPDSKLNAKSEYFHYCILGQNQFPQQTLNLIKDKTVQEKPIRLDIFDSGLIPEEVLSTCHLLFINRSEKHRLSTILSRIKVTPVLTISDIQGFSTYGGMVTLVEIEGQIRFQINLKSLQQADILISSKIMELAEIINEEGPEL